MMMWTAVGLGKVLERI